MKLMRSLWLLSRRFLTDFFEKILDKSEKKNIIKVSDMLQMR